MNPQTAVVPNNGYYRVPKLAEKADCSVPTIWRWAQRDLCPPIVRIGPGVSGGRRSEWDQFFADPAVWRARNKKAA